MSIKLKNLSLLQRSVDLNDLPEGKLLINTINAHSYNMAQEDELFAEALTNGVLIPDGISIVKAINWFEDSKIERTTGWDLFMFEMDRLNKRGGTCFFLGSNESVLEAIKNNAAIDYPNIQIVSYSPPYKSDFTEEENKVMIEAINSAQPDLLWIGMTAPKQEKWVYSHWDELKINCHVGTVGAVFDFYAGTIKRAPLWWQKNNLEWLYRLIQEPRRLWKRYLIGNIIFLYKILKDRLFEVDS